MIKAYNCTINFTAPQPTDPLVVQVEGGSAADVAHHFLLAVLKDKESGERDRASGEKVKVEFDPVKDTATIEDVDTIIEIERAAID